jgi:carnitine O-acetyltransferase
MATRTFNKPASLDKTIALAVAKDMSQANNTTKQSLSQQKDPNSGKESGHGLTYAFQDQLPKLPIPDLESSCNSYLSALHPLQSPKEHAETKAALKEFLRSDGPEMQEKLQKYASGRANYIEQFCM